MTGEKTMNENERRNAAANVIASLMQWETRGRLGWDASRNTLSINGRGYLTWSADLPRNRFVRIILERDCLLAEQLEDHVAIARSFIQTGVEFEKRANERRAYEQRMRKLLGSLMRRKGAETIRIIDFTCAPVVVGGDDKFGVDVSIKIDVVGDTFRHTFRVEDEDDLRSKFAEVLRTVPSLVS